VQSAVKLLAKAAKKRVLHKKTASRRVSRLMKAANRSAK
jgi:small subunit ribosomal protein S20